MTSVASWRRVAVVAAFAVSAVVLAVLVQAPPARALTVVNVANETEFRAALAYFNTEVPTGPYQINITSNFTISTTTDPEYRADIDLTIVGNDFTVSAANPGVRFLDARTGNDATLRIEDLTVSGFTHSVASPTAIINGGALYSVDYNVQLVGTTFRDNEITVTTGSDSTARGGAISLRRGSLTIEESSFIDNAVRTTSDRAFSFGGAVYAQNADVDISTSAFEGNVAAGTATVRSNVRGGALDLVAGGAGGDTTITGSQFEENSVAVTLSGTGNFAQARGGALASTGSGTSDIQETNFVDNTAQVDNSATGGPTMRAYGGAYFSNSRTVTTTDVDFLSNDAIGSTTEGGPVLVRGGAAAILGGEATFTSGEVTENSAEVSSTGGATLNSNLDALGGAFYFGRAATIQGGYSFIENTARVTHDGGQANIDVWGGAITGALESEVLNLSDAEFTDNEAHLDAVSGSNQVLGNSYGGAVRADDGPLNIQKSTFDGNTATAITDAAEDISDLNDERSRARAWGGAVYANTGTVTVNEASFTSNTADADASSTPNTVEAIARAFGGAFYGGASEVTFGKTLFANNLATAAAVSTVSSRTLTEGGAVRANNLTSVTNVTVTGNKATATAGVDQLLSRGGGIVSRADTFKAEYSTFVDNESTNGAHVFVSDDFEPEASVFFGELGSVGCTVGGSISSAGHNFDGDGTCTDSFSGTGDFNSLSGAMLGPLQDNGGFSHTREPLEGSPLIDVIADADCTVTDSDDQRGVERPLGVGDMCDIGAVEVIPDIKFDITDIDTGEDITFTVSGATCLVDGSEGWSSAGSYIPVAPSSIILPYGVFEYELCVPWDGGTVTVKIDVPAPVTSVWKETSGTWAEVTDATIVGTTITFDLTDGGAFDDDGTADGMILDPVAPAITLSLTG